ncbi:class I SAM-dependent methyltransferase [Actinomycetaceae bacterium WB03_NA08]|uniref:Class I SAM-dependent methyltransferase n=1 Tax=Scrofimicrobium canadense TaxID=2652290 RepID=A0A6N7VV09_9ACTO|nr:class I SAM-dependent methyltransferase [Scrofimicrobium canadense]MSS84820.1 class I SAM-dependent methyltransferase [Scrofimicrobium canadense]
MSRCLLHTRCLINLPRNNWFVSQTTKEISGRALAPEFVDSAETDFPHVHFQVGDFCALPVEDGALGGILSWYSVIHTNPVEIPTVLDEFARALRPGGSLLIGFFHGEKIQLFDHAIAPAWFWPIEALAGLCENAQFEIMETHTRADVGKRPHGAIIARRF